MRESLREEPRIPKSSTIFVDYLPHRLRKIWVYNLFSKFGKINHVFIPNKKRKISGQSFEFVRFNRFSDATRAIANTNNSWVWGHRLAVKFARFLKKEDLQENNFSGNRDSLQCRSRSYNSFQPRIQIPKMFHKGYSEKNQTQKLHTKEFGFADPKINVAQQSQKKNRGKEVWRKKGIAESSKQGEDRN